MHQLRVFTFVALVVSLTLWCYWRVMLKPRPPGLASQIGLAVGGIGLLYTHYFSALFLIALGLYHLLFAPRTRRWWRPVIAFVVAGLVFLPEFSVFLHGIAVNSDNTQLRQMAIDAPQVIYYLLYAFGGGSALLFLLALSGLLTGIRQRFGRSEALLIFLSLGTLILIAAANQVMKVMTPDRLRYLMPLWPLFSLLIGLSIWRLRYLSPRLPLVALVLWLGYSLWSSANTGIAAAVEPAELPWREMRADLQTLGSPQGDVFVFHGVPSRIREYYVAATIPMRREIIEEWNTDDDFERYITDTQRVWIGTDWRLYQEFGIDWSQQPEFHRFIALLDHEQFVYCQRFIDHPFMRLEVYARAAVFCPGGAPIARYGNSITLTGFQLVHARRGHAGAGYGLEPRARCAPGDLFGGGPYLRRGE